MDEAEENDTVISWLRVSDDLILKVEVGRWEAHYAMPDDMIFANVVGVRVRRRDLDW